MIHLLLERPDEKVRFFGALTVIIKLNKEKCVKPFKAQSPAEHVTNYAGEALHSAMQTRTSSSFASLAGIWTP